MTRAVFYLMSFIAGAAPFVAGALRAFRTGSDFRLLWMAVASAVGAGLGWVIARRSRPRHLRAGRAALLVLSLSGSLAFLAAVAMGATAPAAVVPVALVIGICWAASYTLAGSAAKR